LKALHPANDNLIDQTRELWSPRVGRDLNPEETRQIIQNVTGFFAVLTDWSRAELRVPANDIAKPYTSDVTEVSDES
jgi:hypothetical protein